MNANKEQVMEYGAMGMHNIEKHTETIQEEAMKQGVTAAAEKANSIGAVLETVIAESHEKPAGPSYFVDPATQIVKDTIAAVGRTTAMALGVMGMPDESVAKESAAAKKDEEIMEDGVIAAAKDAASIGAVLETMIAESHEKPAGPSDFVSPADQLVNDTIAAVGSAKAMELGVMGMPDEAVAKESTAAEKAKKIMEEGVMTAHDLK